MTLNALFYFPLIFCFSRSIANAHNLYFDACIWTHMHMQDMLLDQDFTWTIYVPPQDFVDIAARNQRRAIRSWTLLKVDYFVFFKKKLGMRKDIFFVFWGGWQPRPRIVLLGRGEGFEEVAKEFGCTSKHAVETHCNSFKYSFRELELILTSPRFGKRKMINVYVHAYARAFVYFPFFFFIGRARGSTIRVHLLRVFESMHARVLTCMLFILFFPLYIFFFSLVPRS